MPQNPQNGTSVPSVLDFASASSKNVPLFPILAFDLLGGLGALVAILWFRGLVFSVKSTQQ